MKQFVKPLLFIVLILFFSNTTIFSQTNVKIGFQGGVNFTTPETSPNPVSTTTHVGLLIGAISEIRLSDAGSLLLGLSYIQKRVAPDSSSSLSKTDYFEIPVLLKANLLSPPLRPYFLFGPAIEISVRRNLEVTVANEVQEFDTKNLVQPIDFVIYLGGGAEYQVNSTFDIFGDIRYALGMMNTSRSGNGETKNSGFQFLLGAQVPL